MGFRVKGIRLRARGEAFRFRVNLMYSRFRV